VNRIVPCELHDDGQTVTFTRLPTERVRLAGKAWREQRCPHCGCFPAEIRAEYPEPMLEGGRRIAAILCSLSGFLMGLLAAWVWSRL